jgi:hypothetical protein
MYVSIRLILVSCVTDLVVTAFGSSNSSTQARHH